MVSPARDTRTNDIKCWGCQIQVLHARRWLFTKRPPPCCELRHILQSSLICDGNCLDSPEAGTKPGTDPLMPCVGKPKVERTHLWALKYVRRYAAVFRRSRRDRRRIIWHFSHTTGSVFLYGYTSEETYDWMSTTGNLKDSRLLFSKCKGRLSAAPFDQRPFSA